MTKRSLPLALLGQKFMGRAHANAWRQVGRFFESALEPALELVCARDGVELAAFARRWGFARTTADWRAAVGDESIALVDVATPNDLHAEPAIAALECGKHVACEKPLARDLAEARAMRDAAARSAGRTFVWFNYRRCPAVAFARELVQEGRIGRLYHARARYLQDWGGPATPRSWRFERARAGSGAHGDLHAHAIDLLRFLSGEEFHEVHGAAAATFHARRPDPAGGSVPLVSDVDDALVYTASLTSGALVTSECSRVAGPHQNGLEIELDGENGSLRFAFEEMNLLHFFDAADGRREGGWRRIMCTSAGAHPYAANWWPDAHLLGYEHGFTNMAADILAVLAGGEPRLPLPDFADAYQTQRVLETVLIAARERCAVPLSQVD